MCVGNRLVVGITPCLSVGVGVAGLMEVLSLRLVLMSASLLSFGLVGVLLSLAVRVAFSLAVGVALGRGVRVAVGMRVRR